LTIRSSPQKINISISWIESAEIFERKRDEEKEKAKKRQREHITSRLRSCILHEILLSS
jgi:hypothetical protein